MSQIFVFTAGNPDAKLHLADSIQKPIDDPQAKVFENFDEAYHAELKRISDEAGGFYAWGAVWGVRNRPTWEQMQRDDFVLCVYPFGAPPEAQPAPVSFLVSGSHGRRTGV